MRVLILGGTAEGRALAAALAGQADVEVLSSLAGVVAEPLLPPGAVRVGGFGGPSGLAEFVLAWAADVIVDATHPYAATITRNAVEASASSGVRLIVLRRPEWAPLAGDEWSLVPDIACAAAQVRARPAGCVFLTTGRRDLAAFADDPDHDYLVRAIEPATGLVPARLTTLRDRGPYTVEGELGVLDQHSVTVLVSRNSGGAMTSAKLEAARRRGLPVVMVDRPPLPTGVTIIDTVAGVIDELVGTARTAGDAKG